jgi:hypothetical protein
MVIDGYTGAYGLSWVVVVVAGVFNFCFLPSLS